MGRVSLASRINSLCESERVRAAANLIDWATRISALAGLLWGLFQLL